MATEYMTLTNRLLRRLNEVEIAQADFASVRGIQALAKDAINSAVNDINSMEFEWPFNATITTQVLTVGQEDYNFAATLKIPKWDSFFLIADDALDTAGKPITFISRDVRNRYLKADDDASASDGLNRPSYVSPSQGFGFTLSPSPDQAYSVSYEYFIQPVQLDAYDDTSTIPEYYDEAIIQGGLYHMYMLRDNTEQADKANQKFKQEVNRMRTVLINTEDRIRSTMIVKRRPGNGVHSNDYFRF